MQVFLEQCSVLPDQNRDEHSQSQAALEDEAEGSHTQQQPLEPSALTVQWNPLPFSGVPSESMTAWSLNTSTEANHWASQWLSPHHPGAQLCVQILAVICLTLHHAKFKAVGESYSICTHVHMHCKAQRFIFSSSSWEHLFLYLQEGRFQRPRSARAGKGPPAARQLCCGCARHCKSITPFNFLWGTSSSACTGANPPDRQAEKEAALDLPHLLIPN